MRGKLVFAAILMAATAGCGPSKVDVTGKVSLKNGTPLPGGMLVISPSAGGLQGGARAYLNMDGTFKLSTDTDGDGVADIWNSAPDTLASIANYFRDAGWRPGQPWGVRASVPEAPSSTESPTAVTA